MKHLTKIRIFSFVIFALLIFLIGLVCPVSCAPPYPPSPSSAPSPGSQTKIEQAGLLYDAKGVPILNVDGTGRIHTPASVALHALAYSGREYYEEKMPKKPDPAKFSACIRWLVENLKNHNGKWVWQYNFDLTYNDITIPKPWSSAFGQAVGIQALLASYQDTKNSEHLALARKAAKVLFVPLEKGGLLFRRGEDIWFEEVPYPTENPSHILNGHMRTLIALKQLAEAAKDETIRSWYRRGLATLNRWLPLYDTGYWLRYDLNPRKEELCFRFNNPYGFLLAPLAIHRVSLRDPQTGRETVLLVGSSKDADGPIRIAGNHWGHPEVLDGKIVRRLQPVEPEPAFLDNRKIRPPGTFVYLKIPNTWTDNLRTEPFELSIEYKDESIANINIQMRSIAPGPAFTDLPNGDLLLTGSGQWRTWRIPLRPADLGWWCGEIYGEKHAAYLKELSADLPELNVWAERTIGYLRLRQPKSSEVTIVSPQPQVLPKQTPLLPVYSLDRQGVVRQHAPTPSSRFFPDGSFDPTSDRGRPVYSPFIAARQVMEGNLVGRGGYSEPKETIHRRPALEWLLNSQNSLSVQNARIYLYPFQNVYNDVITEAPWASAFGQAYVCKAFLYALDYLQKEEPRIKKALLQTALGFEIPCNRGGIAWPIAPDQMFFEEVPNGTHVLNGHLVSLTTLKTVADRMKNPKIENLHRCGLAALREQFARFDAGYWLRYDLNPKKELLMQIDWLAGEKSPAVEEILLVDPQTAQATRVFAGAPTAFAGYPKIAGTDWLGNNTMEGRAVRQFRNGYRQRTEPVKGGTRHNVFLRLALPRKNFPELADVPLHRLVIRYKDIAPGIFNLKIQSIHEGKILTFVPLRRGVWRCTGDGKWKEAIFEIRPQDMGWYCHSDYQKFHIEQLRELACQTKDWFFAQQAERQKFFLEAKNQKQSVIVPSPFSSMVPSPIPAALSREEFSDIAREAKVVSAPSMYPGYGVENALDGDPNDDYVAVVEGQPFPQDILLSLGCYRPLRRIRITWESDANYGVEYSLDDVDKTGRAVYRTLISLCNVAGKIHTILLPNGSAAAILRLRVSKVTGQQRILLRRIEIDALPVPESERIWTESSPEHDVVLLAADDPANPLSAWRTPITNRWKMAARQLLGEAKLTDHEKILRFMAVMRNHRVGYPTHDDPLTVMREKIGACGNWTNVLLSLAAAEGIPGRILSLANYPTNNGHAVAELKIGGKWRVYDPTYESFFVRGDPHLSSPDVLSFQELREGKGRARDVVRVVGHTERLRRGKAMAEAFAGVDIYEKADPAGPIGPDKPLTYPLTLAARGNKALLKSADFGPTYQGVSYIGAAGICHFHRWTLTNLQPGQKYVFSFLVSGIGGEQPDQPFRLLVSALEGCRNFQPMEILIQKRATQRVEIFFQAASDRAVFLLHHPYRGPKFHYIPLQEIRLEPAETGRSASRVPPRLPSATVGNRCNARRKTISYA